MANFGYNLEEAKSLNTIDFGWGYDIPFGFKYKVNKDQFLKLEFRLSNKYITFVGSDAYLKENDETVLQTFQYNIGFVKILN